MKDSFRLSPERRVRVVRGNGTYVMAPLGPLPDFPDFDLPPLPTSLVQSLTSTATAFYQLYQRCAAFSLMVDPDLLRWQAVPPTQQCGPEASNWSYIPDDFLDWGRWLVGGSFQIARASGLLPTMQLVPRHDGVHVIVSPDPNVGGLVYLRMHDQPMLIHPQKLLIEDLKDLTSRYRDRFTL